MMNDIISKFAPTIIWIIRKLSTVKCPKIYFTKKKKKKRAREIAKLNLLN